MAAHNHPLNLDRLYREGFFQIRDPGASGTIALTLKGFGICEVVTATAESRALDSATAYGAGTTLLVVLKTDGGNLTITGAAGGSVILDTAGDLAQFIVVDNNGTKQWSLYGTSSAKDYLSTAETTGDIRNEYIRLAFTEDGSVGGEALRAFTNVNANIGTAHGAHISLSYSAEAGGSETEGLGAAIRGTVHIPDVASWAPTGSVYAGAFEIFSDGTASDPNGLTELANLLIANSGNATGKADVDTDGAIFALNGWTAASGTTNVRSSTSLAELPSNTIGFRVKVDGASYYLPLVAAAEWNAS